MSPIMTAMIFCTVREKTTSVHSLHCSRTMSHTVLVRAFNLLMQFGFFS